MVCRPDGAEARTGQDETADRHQVALPSQTETGRCTSKPAALNQAAYSSASGRRSGAWKDEPNTRPSTTSAELAANTMSGSPGTGSTDSTV